MSSRTESLVHTSAPFRRLGRIRLICLLLALTLMSGLLIFTPSIPQIVSQLVIDGPLLMIWLAAAWGIGAATWDLLHRAKKTEAEASQILAIVTQTALGIGLLSLSVLLLGSLGVLSQPVAVGLLVAGILSAVARVLANLPAIRFWLVGKDAEPLPTKLQGSEPSPARTHMTSTAWPLLFVTPILAATVVGALIIPWILWGDEPHAYDVVAYHLQLPREWLELGKITATPHNVFGYFPLNVEMQYLLAMTVHGSATGGMYLAQLMHAGMMILTLGAVYGAVRTTIAFPDAPIPETESRAASDAALTTSGAVAAEWHRQTSRSRLAASVAVVFCAMFPWMMMLGSVAYNECGLMLFTTLAVTWTLRRRWLLAGVCAGFAAGCKITAVPALIALLPLLVLLDSAIRRRFEWRGVALFLLGAALALSPWLIRTAIQTGGNPIFPLAASTLGAGYFDAGMIERFDVAHAARPDQQTLAARFAAFGEQVLRDYKFGSVSLGSVAGPLLLLLIVPALAIRWRDRVAWLLFAIILGNVLIWLFTTHLQGRFLVPIIPVTALLVARSTNRSWLIAVLLVSVVSVPASYMTVFQRITAPAAQMGIGYPDPSVFLPEGVVRGLAASDKPIYLIGDVRAFLYAVPSERLHYRSVFDVPSNESFRDAWLGKDVPDDAVVIVAPSELERFERTYRNLPKMPDEWRGRGMFATDPAFKSFVPVE